MAKKSERVYEKPVWQKEPMFERFALACCLDGGGCNSKIGAVAGNKSS